MGRPFNVVYEETVGESQYFNHWSYMRERVIRKRPNISPEMADDMADVVMELYAELYVNVTIAFSRAIH